MPNIHRSLLSLALATGMLLLVGQRAEAIPLFAHEYDFQCQKCHTVVPQLNAFGEAFLAHGEQLPGVTPDRSVFPLSAKLNFVGTSAPDPGMPKAIVDEVEVYLAGTLGHQQQAPDRERPSYFVEQYLVDGGQPGRTREFWLKTPLTPGLSLKSGVFGLPLPVDPETFRETYADYAIYDQTVGANTFNLFDPRVGMQLSFGDSAHALSGSLLALQGHDPEGLPSQGIDLMGALDQRIGDLTLSTYRYQGHRPTGAIDDAFWRQGLGVVYRHGRWASETVAQIGHDGSADGLGMNVTSRGGFTQVRYRISPRLFTLMRLDATDDGLTGLTHDVAALFGIRTARNSRFTIEDVYTHTDRSMHTLNTQLTVGI